MHRRKHLWATAIETAGVERNAKLAARWYRKAAEQGEAQAQFGLGSCYSEGDGLVKNAKKGLRMVS